MANGVNKVIIDLVDMYESGMSLTDISSGTGIPVSTVRGRIIKAGGRMRGRIESINLCRHKLGSGFRGKKRVFTKEHIAKIGEARRKWGRENRKGFSLKPSGYYEVTFGDNKSRSVHRLIAEEKIGRRLKPNEFVHHVDGDKTNNDPSNLEVMTRAEHTSIHVNDPKRKRDKNGRFCK